MLTGGTGLCHTRIIQLRSAVVPTAWDGRSAVRSVPCGDSVAQCTAPWSVVPVIKASPPKPAAPGLLGASGFFSYLF